jgi:hypothetical protein
LYWRADFELDLQRYSVLTSELLDISLHSSAIRNTGFSEEILATVRDVRHTDICQKAALTQYPDECVDLLAPIGNGKHETVSEYEKHAN